MPDNTPSWEEEANQILMSLEAHIWHELGEKYPVTNQRRLTRRQALTALNSAVKELVLASKPEEVKPGLIWGKDVARGYNKGLDTYQANIIKAIEGKS